MRHRVIFKRLPKGVYGECDKDKRIIWIDLLKSTNPCRTYLHELLHLSYPEQAETWIEREERITWHSMTSAERFALYQALFNRKYRED